MKKLLIGIAVVALSLGTGVAASADERDELQDEIDSNNLQREQLESELEGYDSELQETYLALQDTKDRLPIAREELRSAQDSLDAALRVQEEISARLDFAENELAKLDDEISEAHELIDASQSSLGELARTTYQNGLSLSPTALILSSSSSEDFLSQYSLMESAVRSQTSALTDLNDLDATLRNAEVRQVAVAERITELKEEADAAVRAADEARDDAEAKKIEIESLIVSQQKLAADLEDKRDQVAAQTAQIDSANRTLADEIKAIDEAEREREEERREKEERERQESQDSSQSSGGSSSSSSGSSSSSSGSSSSIQSPIPKPWIVTSPYGYRTHPIFGTRHLHYGVDLRSACGNPQSAAAAGTVTAVRGAAGNGTHGNQVMINHGTINGHRYQTVYNHLLSFSVSVGQQVSAGQTIGLTGATGNVTGCHVHFEVWRDGVTIDPMGLLR